MARPRGVVAVAGSRSLSPQASALVAAVCRSVVASGRSLAVGCAVGADAAVLSAELPVSAVQAFAAFGPVSPPWPAPSCRYSAPGAWSGSAVAAIAAHAQVGGAVTWWAGGSSSVPLPARLAARTSALVSAASAGCVLFFGSPSSKGTALSGRLAFGRGLPVLAFPVGFPGSALPPLGAGSWVPVSGSGAWSTAWRWVPSSPRIF